VTSGDPLQVERDSREVQMKVAGHSEQIRKDHVG